MTRLALAMMIGPVILGTACAPISPGTADSPTPVMGTDSVGTAWMGTIEPIFATPLPPDFTPPPTLPAPTATAVPRIAGGLGPTELKYRLLARFPDLFFCDPDYYPVAREDELQIARRRLPELEANSEEFEAILAHNGRVGLLNPLDDDLLVIYREHKRLAAVLFELTGDSYRFQIQVAKAEGEGELVTGLIDGQGSITVLERTPSVAACPICLAEGTVIDTPFGELPVRGLRVGMMVWTVDAAGSRIAQPVARIARTIVPANHEVVHLTLEDGRELWVSPGHPTVDGIRAGQLQVGDVLAGGVILDAERVGYAGGATYDVLPAGETGFYWANGILLASTLKPVGPSVFESSIDSYLSDIAR